MSDDKKFREVLSKLNPIKCSHCGSMNTEELPDHHPFVICNDCSYATMIVDDTEWYYDSRVLNPAYVRVEKK